MMVEASTSQTWVYSYLPSRKIYFFEKYATIDIWPESTAYSQTFSSHWCGFERAPLHHYICPCSQWGALFDSTNSGMRYSLCFKKYFFVSIQYHHLFDHIDFSIFPIYVYIPRKSILEIWIRNCTLSIWKLPFILFETAIEMNYWKEEMQKSNLDI